MLKTLKRTDFRLNCQQSMYSTTPAKKNRLTINPYDLMDVNDAARSFNFIDSDFENQSDDLQLDVQKV